MLHTDRKTNNIELAKEHYSVMRNLLKSAKLNYREASNVKAQTTEYERNSAENFCSFNCEDLSKKGEGFDYNSCLKNCVDMYSSNLGLVKNKKIEVDRLVQVHNDVGSNFFMH